MSDTLNRATIIGFLGADPETITSRDGGISFVRLSIATSVNWTDKTTTERKSKTTWHRIQIFNPYFAKIATDFLKKGRKIYLEGSIENSQYVDQQGITRYSTQIVLGRYSGELKLLDSKPATTGGSNEPMATPPLGDPPTSGDWDNTALEHMEFPD